MIRGCWTGVLAAAVERMDHIVADPGPTCTAQVAAALFPAFGSLLLLFWPGGQAWIDPAFQQGVVDGVSPDTGLGGYWLLPGPALQCWSACRLWPESCVVSAEHNLFQHVCPPIILMCQPQPDMCDDQDREQRAEDIGMQEQCGSPALIGHYPRQWHSEEQQVEGPLTEPCQNPEEFRRLQRFRRYAISQAQKQANHRKHYYRHSDREMNGCRRGKTEIKSLAPHSLRKQQVEQ